MASQEEGGKGLPWHQMEEVLVCSEEHLSLLVHLWDGKLTHHKQKQTLWLLSDVQIHLETSWKFQSQNQIVYPWVLPVFLKPTFPFFYISMLSWILFSGRESRRIYKSSRLHCWPSQRMQKETVRSACASIYMKDLTRDIIPPGSALHLFNVVFSINTSVPPRM